MRNTKPDLIKFSLAIILIPIGLLTKAYNGFGSEFIQNYMGGIIYVIFFIVLTSLVFPQAAPLKISLIVLCVTCLLELSQLIQISFINSLRKQYIIRALIGSVYNTFDFVFYLLGAIMGYSVLLILKNRTEK